MGPDELPAPFLRHVRPFPAALPACVFLDVRLHIKVDFQADHGNQYRLGLPENQL
jgi:hypothetical protein